MGILLRDSIACRQDKRVAYASIYFCQNGALFNLLTDLRQSYLMCFVGLWRIVKL